MENKGKMIRVLLTRARIDPHDRGMRYLARKLVEAGLEVIYTRHASAEEIVATALEEDVDVLGIGFSCTDPLKTVAKVSRLLKEKRLSRMVLIVGGIIPEEERPRLMEEGVKQIYGPGSQPDDIAAFINSAAQAGKS
jgi:methylmalonyl-CoA mutase C-terminal domain/subunit